MNKKKDEKLVRESISLSSKRLLNTRVYPSVRGPLGIASKKFQLESPLTWFFLLLSKWKSPDQKESVKIRSKMKCVVDLRKLTFLNTQHIHHMMFTHHLIPCNQYRHTMYNVHCTGKYIHNMYRWIPVYYIGIIQCNTLSV